MSDPENKLWCSVRTDDSGLHQTGSWGHCSQDCQVDSGDVGPPTTSSGPENVERKPSGPEQPCVTSQGLQGTCVPFALCSGIFPTESDGAACAGGGLSKVCCPERLESDVSFAFGAPENPSGVPNANTPKDVSLEDIDSRFESFTTSSCPEKMHILISNNLAD